METPTPPRTLSLQRPLLAGEDVRQLQVMLAELVDPGLQIDGLFGPRTEDALRKFQHTKLQMRPDGVCGPRTWLALREAMARPMAIRPGAEPSVIQRALSAVGKLLER